MPLYQITLFYPNLKDHQTTVRRVRDDVQAIAGKNWRVLSAGERLCAIGFAAALTHEQLRARLGNYGSEHFQFLLTEVSAVLDGYLQPGAIQWLQSHLPDRR